MNTRLSNKELKDIYHLDEAHKWMEIVDENELNHPHFNTYLKQKKRLENLLKYIRFNPNHVVAEYGCGNGIWGEMIHKKVKSYVGVDFSEEFINLSEKRHRAHNIKNSKFHCEDIVAFAKNHPNEFDQAYSMDFSEHIYDNDFIAIFSAIKDTLKTNGDLYIHTPNGNYFLEILKKHGILKQSIGHIGIRNANEHIKLLKQIGFKNVEIYYLPHYIKSLSYLHFLSYLPLVGKFFKARLLIKCSK